MSRVFALFSHPDVQQAMTLVFCALIPSLMTGLSRKPGPYTNAGVAALKFILDRLSVVTHADSPGTLKAPFTGSGPSMAGADPINTSRVGGFASIPALLVLIAATLLLSLAAHADAPPPRVTQVLPMVAESDPPPSSTYGGCVGRWTCFQPSVSIAPLAVNLRTHTVEAGFQPGVGYGVTIHKGEWYSFGVDAYLALDVGAQRFSIAVMGKAVNGYLRFGWSKGFIGDSNATSPRLLFGIGTDL